MTRPSSRTTKGFYADDRNNSLSHWTATTMTISTTLTQFRSKKILRIEEVRKTDGLQQSSWWWWRMHSCRGVQTRRGNSIVPRASYFQECLGQWGSTIRTGRCVHCDHLQGRGAIPNVGTIVGPPCSQLLGIPWRKFTQTDCNLCRKISSPKHSAWLQTDSSEGLRTRFFCPRNVRTEGVT